MFDCLVMLLWRQEGVLEYSRSLSTLTTQANLTGNIFFTIYNEKSLIFICMISPIYTRD